MAVVSCYSCCHLSMLLSLLSVVTDICAFADISGPYNF